MQGFKSFAEPVSIEFNKGVTCIVGPNGSGKSNISDAIRWVLGEQSPKALRGGKMDEVIFAGTANRRSRGMAEVTLVIDNSSGKLPIDYNEVAITRRMYRSGESEYLINNNHCRLKDIRELIMDTGIGVDGYSLIGQGKIADIVANKTESRREIFEEAAGIVMYRTKKAEAERKLVNANQNLERVNDIVSEIEGRITDLREDSIKATEYIGLRDKYKELEINITLKNIENVELKNEYLKDDISEINAEIDELKESKQEIDAIVAENRKRSEVLEELYSEANRKLVASIEEINTLVNQREVSVERLVAIEENTKRLQQEILNLDKRLEKEENNKNEKELIRKELLGKLNILEDNLKDKIAAHTQITSDNSSKAAHIDQMKNEIFELHNGNAKKTAEINSLENLIVTLNKRKEQLSEEIQNAAIEKESVLKAKCSLEDELKNLRTQDHDLKNSIRALKEKQLKVIDSERLISKELEESKLSIGQKTSRKKTIEEMESNYEGYNYAVKYVMKSSFRGIHGVVAELMQVPQGYEVAIETALGAAMQNIVCQTDKDAQYVINALKENRAGRLTFLPVESIKGRTMSEQRLESSKGFLGYGVDCISFDEKFKNIFEYLLGRVIVVDNMSNAITLSKQAPQGIRFVTIEGEIINSGGAITGGKYKNNTANLLERKAEIERLEKEIKDLEKLKASAQINLEKLRNEMNSLGFELQQNETEKRNLEVSLMSKQNQLELTESVLQDNSESSEKYFRELQSIDNETESANAMIRDVRQNLTKAESDISDLEQKIEIEMAAFEEEKEKILEAGEDITKARIDLTSVNEQKTAMDNMVEKIDEDIERLREEKSDRENMLQQLLTQRTEISGGNVDIDVVVTEKEKAKESLEEYINELTEEKAQVASGLSADSAKKDEIDEKLNTLQNSKFEMEIKQGKNETQLENYKEKLWQDFEVSYVQAMDFKKRDFNMNVAVAESRKIKSRMKELGEVNIGAIKEYASVSERYEFLTAQRKDILEATESLTKIINDMDRTITAKFKESFDAVVVNFESIFRELFGGGHAELRLDDETKPLESGIDIIAQPPGKKLQNINLMSGGEKTMTAIALMFAVLKTKPTPFCILDEVEAALDDANIDRFANYLKQFEDIQFTLVTHQKATMEHADVLYGVTMPEHGISKVISLRLGDQFELD